MVNSNQLPPWDVSEMAGHGTTLFPVPAHLVALYDFDSDNTAETDDIHRQPADYNGATVPASDPDNHADIFTNELSSADSFRDMKLAQLLQPDRVPNRKQYLRTHIMMCMVSLLTTCGFVAVRSLMYALHGDLGLYGLSLYCSWYALTTIMVASVVNAKLGPRLTTSLAIICHALFLLSNSVDCHVTILVGAGLAGVGTALLRSAHATCERSLGVLYASVSERNLREVSATFNTVSSLMSQAGVAIGNIVSSITLLHLAPFINDYYNTETHELRPLPRLRIIAEPLLIRNSSDICDVWCLRAAQPSQPVLTGMYSIFAGFLAMGLCVLVCIMTKLDIIYGSKCAAKVCRPALLGIFLTLVEPKLLLTLGTVAYMAYIQALLYGDLLKSYIGCRLGVAYIGYIMTSYVVAKLIASAVSVFLRRSLKRIGISIMGFLVACSVLVALYTWNMETRTFGAYFCLFGAMGASDGLLVTQQQASVAAICRGNHGDHMVTLMKVFKASVTAVALGASPLVCLGTKILLGFGLLGLALGTSLATEGLNSRPQQRLGNQPARL